MGCPDSKKSAAGRVLGHRRSVDFDWFLEDRIPDPLLLARELQDEVPFVTSGVEPRTLFGTRSGGNYLRAWCRSHPLWSSPRLSTPGSTRTRGPPDGIGTSLCVITTAVASSSILACDTRGLV